MVNWNEEVENMKTSTEFLKLDMGQHKVTFLDDGEDKIVKYDEKEVVKRFFRVKHNNEEKIWTMAKSETLNSLYGQIALIGRQYGSLVNQEITIKVKGEGKKKSYDVVEAFELTNTEIKRRKDNEQKVEQVNV